jgi:hypothetical protein
VAEEVEAVVVEAGGDAVEAEEVAKEDKEVAEEVGEVAAEDADGVEVKEPLRKQKTPSCSSSKRTYLTFYAPEAHIYLSYSFLFISDKICNGGGGGVGASGPSRVIKFLNAPERPEQGD